MSTETLHASAERRIIAAASEGMQPLCSKQRQHLWEHWNSEAIVAELPTVWMGVILVLKYIFEFKKSNQSTHKQSCETLLGVGFVLNSFLKL